MKLFLEEEQEDEDKNKIIVKIQEISKEDSPSSFKEIGEKRYIHTCYHDEKNPRPCKREAI